MIDTTLTDIIDRQSASNRVGCFLSAGADSLSLAFSAHRLGKKLSCYSFYVDGKETSDSIGARIAAEHFGWDFTAIDVPVDNLKEDFFTLVNDYHCVKKPHRKDSCSSMFGAQTNISVASFPEQISILISGKCKHGIANSRLTWISTSWCIANPDTAAISPLKH